MTGKVAPHLNCEVRLVMAGVKPLAVIERSKDVYGYSLARALGNTGALNIVRDLSNNDFIVTKPENKHLAGYYLYLLNNGVKELGIKQYHREMGKLFGYTSEDIEAFIKAEVKCDCEKCKGRS